MERTRDRSSTPGHPEAGGQEGITNDPSWQETLPRACDAIAPPPVLSPPPRGHRQAARRSATSAGTLLDTTLLTYDAYRAW